MKLQGVAVVYNVSRSAMNDHPDASTRQRLIDATLEVIAQHGVSGIRVNDIAQRAATTTGSLYWFFKSRRGLINAALAEQFASQMRVVIDLVDTLMAHGDVTLDMLFQQRFDFAAPERVAARRQRIEVLAAALTDPDLAAEVATVQRDLLRTATAVVERAQQRGQARSDIDPYSYALFIQAMSIGFAVADLSPDLMPGFDQWWGVNRLVVESLQIPPTET